MTGKIIQYTTVTAAKIIAALRNGDLVAIPTETVYGLAANALDDLAVAKIYATKDRPQFNPLITHVANVEQARQYGIFNELALRLAEAFWPGPLTMILPQTANCPISKLVTAGLDTIALRVPSHPVALAIIEQSGLPLAAPSANPSGRLSPTRAEHVASGFAGCEQPAYIVNGGEAALGLESTIIRVNASSVDILRHGHVTRADLEKFTIINQENTFSEKPVSPGQLLRHYSPRNPVRLNATTVDPDEVLLAFGAALPGAFETLNLSVTTDLLEAAANLFKMLHALDAYGRTIAIMPIPGHGLGGAINDRISRS